MAASHRCKIQKPCRVAINQVSIHEQANSEAAGNLSRGAANAVSLRAANWMEVDAFFPAARGAGPFVGREMRNRKTISPHQAPPAEMSPAPGRAPVASQSLPAEPKPAPSIPSATLQPVVPAPLPAEVTLLEAVSLTVKREGRVAGVVHLQPGQRVTPISVNGGMMSVVRGSAAGSCRLDRPIMAG